MWHEARLAVKPGVDDRPTADDAGAVAGDARAIQLPRGDRAGRGGRGTLRVHEDGVEGVQRRRQEERAPTSGVHSVVNPDDGPPASTWGPWRSSRRKRAATLFGRRRPGCGYLRRVRRARLAVLDATRGSPRVGRESAPWNGADSRRMAGRKSEPRVLASGRIALTPSARTRTSSAPRPGPRTGARRPCSSSARWRSCRRGACATARRRSRRRGCGSRPRGCR